MTRLWERAERLAMETDADGQPLRFTCNGQAHTVQHIAKRWRADLEWWKGRIWREYYKLSTEDGLLVVVYRDLVSDAWYWQRVYD